ncbi:hypothetical protein [Gimesia maris]|uniref:Prevent-host-death protein n=1 Tax=Gimesia maris TaxID=122 RepID=A0ABX5YH47_9PLAN|nr:hypothetical protein [Gimesia maris]QEG14964.1 hypothetical protein GmarT_08020 [Gimesia maris]QGQ31664.1 hypothetical protein F1729_25205 [Gimesia maris]
MNLTQAQSEAVSRGEIVSIKVGELDCILIREDLFEKLQKIRDTEESYSAVIEALDDENPDQYLEYLNEK